MTIVPLEAPVGNRVGDYHPKAAGEQRQWGQPELNIVKASESAGDPKPLSLTRV